MSKYHFRWGGLASLFCLFSIAIAPVSAQSDSLFTQAEVETFRNRVDIWLPGGLVRPLRDRDRLGFGDTILTQQASQVDLRLNDGSQVRLGEFATFWFVPNTRDLRLGHGTALLRLPPGHSPSTLETPNAIAEIQGGAVVVRYVRPVDAAAAADDSAAPRETFAAAGGRTAVMVLTSHADRPVQVSLRNGRSVDLLAGQLAIVDNDNLYIFEFDQALFYDTSSLVQGLSLEPPDTGREQSAHDAAAALDGANAESPSDFVGAYWLDPQFLSPEGNATAAGGWLFPVESSTATPNATTDVAPATDAEGASLETHDTSAADMELMPPPTAPAASETQLTPPSANNSDDADVPAGVIAPPESAPPALEPPVPTDDPNLPAVE